MSFVNTVIDRCVLIAAMQVIAVDITHDVCAAQHHLRACPATSASLYLQPEGLAGHHGGGRRHRCHTLSHRYSPHVHEQLAASAF